MAFMPFMVKRAGPYCTMKIMKSMKVMMNSGNYRGLPRLVQSSFEEIPTGKALVSLVLLAVKCSG
jgi:hypothetical protein